LHRARAVSYILYHSAGREKDSFGRRILSGNWRVSTVATRETCRPRWCVSNDGRRSCTTNQTHPRFLAV